MKKIGQFHPTITWIRFGQFHSTITWKKIGQFSKKIGYFGPRSDNFWLFGKCSDNFIQAGQFGPKKIGQFRQDRSIWTQRSDSLNGSSDILNPDRSISQKRSVILNEFLSSDNFMDRTIWLFQKWKFGQFRPNSLYGLLTCTPMDRNDKNVTIGPQLRSCTPHSEIFFKLDPCS